MTKKRFRQLAGNAAALPPCRWKKKRAFMASMLAAVMISVTVMSPAGSSITVHAAGEPAAGVSTKNIITDMSLLAPSGGKWDSSDNKVWYGQYNGNPTAYRVLKNDSANKQLLLDCDTILKTGIQFKDSYSKSGDNLWSSSILQDFLNNKWLPDNFNYSNSVFTSMEECVIDYTSLPASSEFGYTVNGTKYIDKASSNNFFVLSVSEANTLYADSAARIKTGGGTWWLRSSSTSSNGDVGVVNSSGNIGTDITVRQFGVSPAFNINSNYVVFASPKGENKADSFALTKNSTAKDWILTITNGDTIQAYRTSASDTFEPGDTVMVNVSSVPSNTYTQLSAMLVDSSGTVVSYGKIKNEATNGDVPITIPEGVTSVAGDYTLKVFAENVRSSATDIRTDYSTYAASIPLKIEPKYDVNIQAGTGAALTSDSATANQTIVGGQSMTIATYKAAEGYYFPLGYGFEQNGVLVGRIDDKHVSIAGYPTADANISITASPVSDRATPATNKQNINLGAGTLVTAYNSAAGLDTGLARWVNDGTGARVYFGQYDGTNGTLYRVLESDGATAYFDCDTGLFERSFNSNGVVNAAQKSGNQNEYNGSDLQAAINGSELYDKSGVFSSTEKSAIQKAVLAAENAYVMNSYTTVMDYASQDYIFPISGRDAIRYYSMSWDHYAGPDPSSQKPNSVNYHNWWLRSASSSKPGYVCIFIHNAPYQTYAIDSFNVYTSFPNVSPAFHVDLSSVLFTTAAGTDKTAFTAVGSDKVSANTWELTMQAADGNMNAALASDNSGSTKLPSAYTAQTYSVSHAAASSVLPGATQVSAALTKVGSDGKDAGLAYYGQVNSDVSAVKSSVSLPTGLADGTYHLYVFAEDVNGNNQTDYASALGTPITVRIQDTVISTDITWGSMEFTYNDGNWNTETHVWDGAGWEPSSTDADKIAVQNNGNVNVTVSFSYKQNDELNWLSSNNSYSMAGSFTDGTNPVVSAMPLSAGAGKSVYLKIDGNIPRSSNYRTVGTVTVTLTDSE